MLPFHQSMALQLLPPLTEPQNNESDSSNTDDLLQHRDKEASDGFIVSARGLSLHKTVLGQFIKIHATPSNLVLLLNCSTEETEALFTDARQREATTDPPLSLCAIANETPAPTRKLRYLGGGVISCTSRILVVDMLNGVVPLHLVTGVLVCHAHRITETSTEAFILRLLRESNKVAFIRAFSESPESLTNTGVLWKLEKTMKLLYLRKVFFWPRFHLEIQETIDAVPPISVHQIRVPMTKNMADIQAAIIDCINESILEIKRAHRFVDPDELSVEHALFASFEQLLKMQLDPIWHRVGLRTKQIVSDISTLRRLLGYLTTYDCVAFYSFLESIQAANALDPLQTSRTDASVSPWLFYDATDIVFSTAKKRVFRKVAGTGNTDETATATAATAATAAAVASRNTIRFGTASTNLYIPEGIEIVAEEQPKWSAIRDLVKEIVMKRNHAAGEGERGPILVMVHGERTCTQLSEILSNHIFNKTDTRPTPATATTASKKRTRSTIMSSDDEELPPPPQPAAPRPANTQSRRRQRGGSTTASTSKTTIQPPSSSSTTNNPATTPAQTTTSTLPFSTKGAKSLMAKQVSNYFKWKGSVSNVERNIRFKKFRNNNNGNRGRGGGTASGNLRGNLVGSRGGGFSRGASSGSGRGVAAGASLQSRRRLRGGGAGGAAANREIDSISRALGDGSSGVESIDGDQSDM